MSERLDEIRRLISDEHQDDEQYVTPEVPSEFAALTDDELLRLYRKIARANLHPHSSRFEMELTARLAIALKEFRSASDRASSRLYWLTVVLVLLTLVIVALTVVLVATA